MQISFLSSFWFSATNNNFQQNIQTVHSQDFTLTVVFLHPDPYITVSVTRLGVKTMLIFLEKNPTLSLTFHRKL